MKDIYLNPEGMIAITSIRLWDVIATFS